MFILFIHFLSILFFLPLPLSPFISLLLSLPLPSFPQIQRTACDCLFDLTTECGSNLTKYSTSLLQNIMRAFQLYGKRNLIHLTRFLSSFISTCHSVVCVDKTVLASFVKPLGKILLSTPPSSLLFLLHLLLPHLPIPPPPLFFTFFFHLFSLHIHSTHSLTIRNSLLLHYLA